MSLSLFNSLKNQNNIKLIEKILEEGADINGRYPNGITPLICSIFLNSDIVTITFLLDKGANVNAKDDYNETALHYAINMNSDKKIIECLLRHGADINSKNNQGKTPLILSFINKLDKEIILLLIAYSENSNLKNFASVPIISYSVIFKPDIQIIEELIKHGADVNAFLEVDYRTALHYAIKMDSDKKIIKLLLNRGADVNAKDITGFSCLDYAICSRSDIKIIKLLLDRGADVNSKGYGDTTPLYNALIYNPDANIIRFLINRGANVNDKDIMGCGFLTVALREKVDIYIIKMLIDNGINVNTCNNLNNNLIPTALHVAVFYNSNINTINLLIKEGAFINSVNYLNENPLHLAVMLNFENIIKHLINNGADTNAKDDINNNILHKAILYNSDVSVIKYIIENFGNVNSRNKEKFTPLHIELGCTKYNYIIKNQDLSKGDKIGLDNSKYYKEARKDVVNLLLESGADVNAITVYGETPLHIAIRCHASLEILELLIKYGANVMAKDKDGRTPLICAIYYNYINRTRESECKHKVDAKTKLSEEEDKNEIYENSYPLKVIKLLINKGANVNDCDKFFGNCLHYAACNLPESIPLLIKYCANIKQKNIWDVIPLHFALMSKLPQKYIKQLINECTINAKDNNEMTPLLYALRFKNKKNVIDLLIEKGANVYSRDIENNSAIQYELGYEAGLDIVKYINDKEQRSISTRFIFPLQNIITFKKESKYFDLFKPYETEFKNLSLNNSKIFARNIHFAYHLFKNKILKFNDGEDYGLSKDIKGKDISSYLLFKILMEYHLLL